MLHPDIISNIKFYTTEENGRKSPTNHHQFGCIFFVDNKMHDCRLLLDEIGSITPGEYKKNVPIKFLSPELILPILKKGLKFYLWDMRNIAEGEIIIINSSK
jgi:hypothetical protein